MLFRDINTGKIVKIDRSNYHTNTDYYNAIAKLYNINFPKLTNDHDRMLSLIKTKKVR